MPEIKIPERIKNELKGLRKAFDCLLTEYYAQTVGTLNPNKDKSDCLYKVGEEIVSKAAELVDPYEDGYYIRELFWDAPIPFTDHTYIYELDEYFDFIEESVSTEIGRMDEKVRDVMELASIYCEVLDRTHKEHDSDELYEELYKSHYFSRVGSLCWLRPIEGDDSAERIEDFLYALGEKVMALRHNIISFNKHRVYSTEK